VRQLLPDLVDPVDPLVVYRDRPEVAGRAAVRLNMIASIDGATTVGGLSGGLGGPADQRVFSVLRSLADAVLVAAGTARAEGYGPAPLPIAIVSRSCVLDWQAPLFTESAVRPLVVTVTSAPEDNRARAAEVADVVLAGDDRVDMRRAIDALEARGARHVLAEGGPSLNTQLAAAGLLDELCLSLAPWLVAGDSKRILAGPELDPPHRHELRSVCEEGGYLFLRYRAPLANEKRTSRKDIDDAHRKAGGAL
jgi:riboflavin biosynthesis pyrimidine reductase